LVGLDGERGRIGGRSLNRQRSQPRRGHAEKTPPCPPKTDAGDIGMDRGIREWLHKHYTAWAAAHPPPQNPAPPTPPA
jgi:hypothetical protein